MTALIKHLTYLGYVDLSDSIGQDGRKKFICYLTVPGWLKYEDLKKERHLVKKHSWQCLLVSMFLRKIGCEPCGKPVIYTWCKDVADGSRPHFDVEHSLRIEWEINKMDDALRSIKATIRNTLPDALNEE